MSEHGIRAAAVAVLGKNWEHDHTVPSRRLYPHQWSWDSAFTAVGWAHVDPERARLELESLLGAQWADGRVPQIAFDPGTARDAYAPGPDFWRSAQVPGAPVRETSGIVQPPLHAVAAWEVFRADPGPGRAFLERVYSGLRSQHEYLRRERADGDLAVIVHPWESGQDNCPSWDAELAGVAPPADALDGYQRRDLDHADPADRPTDRDYAAYIHLAGRYRDHGYRDADALPDHSFVVTDPLFNALLGWSDEALARIADELGLLAQQHRDDARRVRDALLTELWDADAGHFFARGRHSGRTVEYAVGGLAPLVLDLPADVVDALVRGIRGPRFALDDRGPLPSYDRTAPGFDPTRYWRGAAWVNTSWLVLRGLERHGRHDEADTLRAALLTAVGDGFFEYYDPLTGTGRGSPEFSWSAALVLDVLARVPGGVAR
ncbi:hypothetical protein WIS52_24755 [Pseudonocardia nematodicida]|uniref:Mannosylglycerate hydrolase MGH1-like glycoside hydrolase domain-containing protein n=1 Tax=Pseudonocardia nematodicida TaxID=1206997 RepID=A0ABV1KGV8_9PSEU